MLSRLKYRNFHIATTIMNSMAVSVNHRRMRWVRGTLANSRCTAGENPKSIFGITQIGVR